MNYSVEIEAKIKSLEAARKLLDEELEKLSEQLKRAVENESELARNVFMSDRKTKNIGNFFRDHGYLIVDCKTQTPSDIPYLLAKQLWGCYHCVLPLFQELYKAKEEFVFSIEDLSTDDRTSILNFCQSLKRQNWITYQSKKKEISITPSIPKEHRNFFLGGWAEAVTRFLVYRTLSAYSQKSNQSHKVFWNVCLKKIGSSRTNSNDMELDIVVDLGDRFYIFETKSGQVLCVDKWIDRARIFHRKNCRFITCCMDADINPKLFSPYKLFALPTLERQLTELLERDLSSHIQT